MIKNTQSEIRIIGGKWRGRKIIFEPSDATSLRPTPNRLRETLFNWLSPVIAGSSCLDAFGGSGALGLEALSRGAGQVTIIEKHPKTLKYIQENATRFEASNLSLICADTLHYLATLQEKFDVIFLDPPFQYEALPKLLNIIAKSQLLTPEGYLYIESARAIDFALLNLPWQVFRTQKAGHVVATLGTYP